MEPLKTACLILEPNGIQNRRLNDSVVDSRHLSTYQSITNLYDLTFSARKTNQFSNAHHDTSSQYIRTYIN